MKLALFDVDFTLTKKETLIAFFTYLVKKKPSLLLHLPKAVASGLFYKLGIHKEKETKEMFLAFLENLSMETVDQLSNDFIEEELIHFLYADGIEKVKELKSKGYLIVLTSASPEFYISKLKEVFDADYVMGTRFIEKDGKFVSNMGEKITREKKKFEDFSKYLTKRRSILWTPICSQIP